MTAIRTAALSALACALAGAAFAQEHDAPLSTSTGAGWVDQSAVEPEAVSVPNTAARNTAPAEDPLAALKNVRDTSFSGLHGSVSAMVGSHDTRGVAANVNGPIGDKGFFSLSFSSVRSDAAPYGYGYGSPYGYGYGYPAGYPYSLSGWRGVNGSLGYGGYGGYGSGSSTSVGIGFGWGPNAGGREVTRDVTDEPEGRGW